MFKPVMWMILMKCCVSVFQEGETPLIKATKMRNIEIVELLLDKGAKVSAVDKVGSSNTFTCTHTLMENVTSNQSFLVLFRLMIGVCFVSERRHSPPHRHPRPQPQAGRAAAEEP